MKPGLHTVTSRRIRMQIIGLAGCLGLIAAGVALAADSSSSDAAPSIIDRAKLIWESGTTAPALDLLDEALANHPQASALQALRGDILSTVRRGPDAVHAYTRALTSAPDALAVRWAKWSVLLRSGRMDESITELQQIAQHDPRNPLAQLRLAQELRKLDRLEESLEAFIKAVALAPDLLSWRLALARARFDLLDYRGADDDVQYVLNHLPPDSPLVLPAKNQLAQLYESMERGRRYAATMTPVATEDQLKEWASIRAEAWRLFVAGRFQEAVPIFRRVLTLNPKDPLATHQLGVTLMQLGQCREALTIFGSVLNLNPSEEDYADTVFRMGQCLVDLEQWEEAFVHFQTLYDAALEFEYANKDVPLPAGTKVLDKQKLARWLEKVRLHVPELADLAAQEGAALTAGPAPSSAPDQAEHAVFDQALAPLAPQNFLDPHTTLIGRDSDFSWFRFVIPAGKVVRDDSPTGAHEFIPLHPNDTFVTTQPDIYLVFGLVSASYDAIPLAAHCYLETADSTGATQLVAQDHVMMAMNDESGYFRLVKPARGWTPGLYRCGLFAGEKTSAYTQADEVRFRIVPAGA
ncbi:MAG: tetratricopeptide repeat protein [Nitrospira sp.]